MQKIPGGLIVVPMFIGLLINTFCPSFLNLGGYTSGIFRDGTSALLGMFLLVNGATISVKKLGEPVYKGVVLTGMKFVVGVIFGLVVTKLCGVAGIFGITPMAIIAAITNSSGGIFLGLTKAYGEDTDAGVIPILALNDGPFFTMVAMGASGMASVPIETLIATIIPLAIGIIWGNLDSTFKEKALEAMPIIMFFMMIPIGASMKLSSFVEGGMSGILLAALSAGTSFIFFVLYQLFLPKRKRSAMGAALGTTAANATSVPSALAEIDPTWAPYASMATAQIAVCSIVTVFTAPIFTAICDKFMRKRQLGIYSKEGSKYDPNFQKT